MKAYIFIFALLLALAATALANMRQEDTTTPTAPNTQWDGNYNVVAGGFYKGRGGAKVLNGILQNLQCKVAGSDGKAQNLVATQITLNGNYFSGPGKINGQNVTITGRFDAPADGEGYAIRLSATYKADDGHGGKLVGMQTK